MDKRKKRGSIVRKSIVGIIIPLVLMALVAGFLGYSSLTNAMSGIYEIDAVNIANTAAVLVDGDRISVYSASNGNTPDYLETLNRMDSLCNTSDVTFIYVICPDLSDFNHITFIFSTINRKSPYTQYEFGYYRETTNEEYKAKYRKLYYEGSDSEIVIRDRGYIETDAHITAMVPVRDSNGRTQAILCVQRQMEQVTSRRNDYLIHVLIALFTIAFVIICLQNRFMKSVFLNPLTSIINEASRFAKDSKLGDTRISRTVRSNDEIGILAESIDSMEESIVNYVDMITKTTAEKQRMLTELNLANRIQANVLPNVSSAFPDRKGFDLFALMVPAKVVGGDFYDFFLIDHNHLCLVVADVSGKGIPAAMFMMAAKNTIANNAKVGKSPARILADSNISIIRSNNEELFVTVWLGILELSTGYLVAANAGHEFPIIKNPDGQFSVFKDKHGVVLGALEDVQYTEYEMKLKPGTKLFLYTDGVPEANNEDNEFFGIERTVEALNATPDADCEHIVANMRESLKGFVREAAQFDDITMMCLEYKG